MGFGCGGENPIGLRLDFILKDGVVEARFTAGERHQGWSGVHGGNTVLADRVDVCCQPGASPSGENRAEVGGPVKKPGGRVLAQQFTHGHIERLELMQRTLVLAKPDAVRRGLVGELLSRLERKGLKVAGLKVLRMDEALARRHYAVHAEKAFFGGLVKYITSGPIAAVVVEGPNVVEMVRRLMGETDPLRAAPGTIRGDFGTSIEENLVHGSDSPENARQEIALFFKPGELLPESG